jgi:N4-gp56 family major capsid protein
MAATTEAHVASSIPELWARLTLRDHLRKGFFANMVGPEGSRSPIIRREDLVSQPGDTIHIQTTSALAGAGVTGETQLEGSEENLTTASISCVPEFYRNGVRWYRRSNKKSVLELRAEARMRLAEWGGEKMDDIRFANFVSQANLNGAAYTSNEYFAGASSASIATVGATDVLSVEELMKIKLTLYNNRALPLKTNMGEDVYGIVCHPNSVFDLKRETEYKDWVREAAVRGANNPFFIGATAMIDGMVVFTHSNVPTQAGEAAASVASNIAFGAEAFVEAVDENPSWDEENFDYGHELGVAYGFGFQPRRALAKNSLVVYTAAVSPL